MVSCHGQHRTFRRSADGRMRRAFGIAVILITASVGSACRSNSGSAAAFDAAYRLGETVSTVALEAFEAERAIESKLTFEPFTYQRVSDLETVPTTTRTCGVMYKLTPERWGIVPDLSYSCTDEQAKADALKEAPSRLRSQLHDAGSEYDARLEALRGPASVLKSDGPTLVYARALGVDFDLGSCVGTVAGRLEKPAVDAAVLQCDTFLKPGSALDDYRTRLTRAAEQALGKTAVSSAQPPAALGADVAARCQADSGTRSLAVPGAVSGQLALGRDTAYAIRLDAGQSVEINMRSTAFDPMLRLHDGSCSRTLATDDDGGGGLNSQIRWTASSSGEYVVVASSLQKQGRGAFELTVSAGTTTRMLSEEERQAIHAFALWVKSASKDDLLATWRGASASNLQLGCLTRERIDSPPIRRASLVGDATSTCLSGLTRATEARKEIVAGQK